MRVEVFPLAIAQFTCGLLDIRCAGASEGVYGMLPSLSLDPYCDQYPGCSFGYRRLRFGGPPGLFVHVRCFIRVADRADQRAGVGADTGSDGDTHRADEGGCGNARSCSHRSTNAAPFGCTNTGMASAGGAFVITAYGVDIMLAVGVEIECSQSFPREARLTQRCQCSVCLILKFESSRNYGVHKRGLRVASVSRE